jgi:uncharacterized protein YndB with AHSA1/START domain
MVHVEMSIIIRRPVEEVFAFVGDQRNGPQWQHGLLEVRRTTEGPLGIGTKHTFVRKFMGLKLEASNEYVMYEPNNLIAFKSTSGSMDFQASYRTESVAEGAKLTSNIEMQPGRFISPAEPLIAASLRREMVANLGDLKDLLESGVAANLS